MSRKREAVFMGIGILTGLALCGPAAQAAEAVLTAAPSSQTFYVDGQRVQFEAYEIHGNNFVKLRDIGRAVDFAVDYDGSTNSVHINSALPYQEEVTAHVQPLPTAPAPQAVTEASVQTALAALREQYPSRSTYPSPYNSSSGGPYGVSSRNCAGWAILCSDAAFGDLPWRRVDRPSWEQIRPGDLVEYKNSESYHVVVVVDKTDEYIKVTESGLNNHTRWGGQYFHWWLEEQPRYILYTRYPS